MCQVGGDPLSCRFAVMQGTHTHSFTALRRLQRLGCGPVTARPRHPSTPPSDPKPLRHGEIVSHGEIERRRTQARHRGACLGSRDAQPLKQFLEALQLKGFLYHTAHLPPAPICTALPPPNAHSRRAPVQSRVAAGASRGQAGTEISWCCDSHCFPPSAASSRVAT
jgi:hypothetical protein